MRSTIIFIFLVLSPLFLISHQYTDIDEKVKPIPFSKNHLRHAHELTEDYQNEVCETRAIFTCLLKLNQSLSIFMEREISKREMNLTGDCPWHAPRRTPKNSIDLSKIRLLGNVGFALIDKGQVTPLIITKVR